MHFQRKRKYRVVFCCSSFFIFQSKTKDGSKFSLKDGPKPYKLYEKYSIDDEAEKKWKWCCIM